MMINFTPDQKKAYKMLCNGENVFLTGAAGTGKSYVLNKFIEKCESEKKNILITAPTGIAAINIGGSTLHRTFSIPVKPLTPGTKYYIPDVVELADIVIIDEISMCRIDVFEYVLRMIEDRRTRKNLQLIVVGDFFQLPPVYNRRERKILDEFYPSLNCFQSKMWEKQNFKTCLLNQVVRQNDPTSISVLNLIRKGDSRGADYINMHHAKKEIEGAITLVPTNKRAEEINKKNLNKLNGKEYKYIAEIAGEVAKNDYPVSDKIILKEKTRVMMMLNDPDNNYQNGSLGEVIKCFDEGIKVKLDNGHVCDLQTHTWEIYRYSYDYYNHKIVKEIAGTFTQLPIKVAYAITIHKSQGQTFEKINLDPNCFCTGQLYVGLSRAKSLDKIYLYKKIKKTDIIAASDVIDFYDRILSQK